MNPTVLRVASLFCLVNWLDVGVGAVGIEFEQNTFVKAPNSDSGDSFGAVAIDGDTLVVGATGEDSSSTGVNGDQKNNGARNSGAAYVYTRDAGGWHLQAYLKASNASDDDRFGASVAISGDTIVVGAFREDGSGTGVDGDPSDNQTTDSGAAYVFVREGTTWTEQAYLKANNPGTQDDFGSSVAISGNTIVVGAPREDSSLVGVNPTGEDDNITRDRGAAYVYVGNGSGAWMQQAYIKSPVAGAPNLCAAIFERRSRSRVTRWSSVPRAPPGAALLSRRGRRACSCMSAT